MCWSIGSSIVGASIGIAGAGWTAYKKLPFAVWGFLAYLALMEILQAITYTVLNQCDHPVNQILTMLAYFHITAQPFFVNALNMYFIPDQIRKKIQYPVYLLCSVSAVIMLLQLYPFEWAGKCILGQTFCGTRLCAVTGTWHLAWDIPINGIGDVAPDSFFWPFPLTMIVYLSVVFLLPILYGSWKLSLFIFVVGPFLVQFLTSNVNEQPAVWCLLSFMVMIVVIIPQIRRLFFVKKWFLWF